MRRILATLVPIVLVAGIIVGGAGPARANADVSATSVATSGVGRETNCADASMAIGLHAVSVTQESGQTSNLGGVLHTFAQASSFDGFDGVFPDYGNSIGTTQPVGTIVGTYAAIGSATPTAANTAEWFILYRCGATTADSVVLSSCFGDYGTCPQTAAEAVSRLFAGSVDDPAPTPGQVVTATGTGCFYPLGGALLLDGSTGLGGASTAPNPDGSYTIPLTVPSDVAPGTPLTVRFDCGTDGQTILSTTVDLTVAAPAPATTTTVAASAPSAPVAAQPRFTG
jgi:hypothetical protein